MYVDPVQQEARYPRKISLYLRGRAAALFFRIGEKTARAGMHYAIFYLQKGERYEKGYLHKIQSKNPCTENLIGNIRCQLNIGVIK